MRRSEWGNFWVPIPAQEARLQHHERPLPPSNTPSCKPFSVLQQKPPSHQTASWCLNLQHTPPTTPLMLCVPCQVTSVVSGSWRPPGLSSTRLHCPWGFSRQKYWTGLLFPPPGDLSELGIEPKSPVAPALPAHSLPLGHGEAGVLLFMSLLKSRSWHDGPTLEGTTG